MKIKGIISGLLGLKRDVGKLARKGKQELKKHNVEQYIPEQIKKRVAPERARTTIGKRILKIVAIGLGAAGAAAAGIGAVRVVRERIIKKAVILVGGGRKALTAGTGFNGYLLRYTDLDGLEDMIDTLAGNAFTELILVPMTVINGYEVDRIKDIAAAKRGFFEKISCAGALLTSNDDYEAVANELISFADGADEDTAVVYVGKGTAHHANASYIALNERIKQMGGDNVFVGTAESYPDIDKVESGIETGMYQNVVLCPLEMSVDAELDEIIGGEENSWYSRLTEDGYNCGCYMKGLCAYKGVRRLIVEHTKAVM